MSNQNSDNLTSEVPEGISLDIVRDDQNPFGNSQNPTQLISYDHHIPSMDFDIFALLQTGEEMFPPLDFLPFQSTFDWSLSNGNGNSEGTY